MSGLARTRTYHRQMERLRERRDRLAVRRLDLVLAGTAVILVGLTAVLLGDSSLSFVVVDRSLDVAVNSLTLLAAASLAALALARYRESGRLAGLFQASAFLLVAWLALLIVAAVVVKAEGQLGLLLGGLPEQTQLSLYVSSVVRIVAGALLVVGGAAAVTMIHRAPGCAVRSFCRPSC